MTMMQSKFGQFVRFSRKNVVLFCRASTKRWLTARTQSSWHNTMTLYQCVENIKCYVLQSKHQVKKLRKFSFNYITWQRFSIAKRFVSEDQLRF